MAARPVRTSALARNQVITSSASSSACVLDGSRLAARRDRVKARTSVRGAADEVRRHLAAAAAPSNSGAKIAMTEQHPATDYDATGLEESPGVRRSALERFLHRARSLASLPTGASRGPPTARACSASPSAECTLCSAARADEHLAERITLLYKLERSSFDFVHGSPRHARHDGSDSRWFHFSTPTHNHPPPTSTLLKILTFLRSCSPCACRIRPCKRRAAPYAPWSRSQERGRRGSSSDGRFPRS